MIEEYSAPIPGTSVQAHVSSYGYAMGYDTMPLTTDTTWKAIWWVDLITDNETPYNIYGHVLDLTGVFLSHEQVAKIAFILLEKKLTGEES